MESWVEGNQSSGYSKNRDVSNEQYEGSRGNGKARLEKGQEVKPAGCTDCLGVGGRERKEQ